MTWNLKNNDPDPARRFAKQPGAGEADGGWHWHSRLPVAARVAQREAPDVLCLQEDMRSMSRELMASAEMSEPGAIRYRCYPSPSLAAPAPTRELLEASDDALDRDALPGRRPESPRRAREGVDGNSAGVWWREDAFEIVDAGQFEWVDGRALRAARRLVEREGMERLRRASGVDAHMCPMTWAALRLRRRARARRRTERARAVSTPSSRAARTSKLATIGTKIVPRSETARGAFAPPWASSNDVFGADVPSWSPAISTCRKCSSTAVCSRARARG